MGVVSDDRLTGRRTLVNMISDVRKYVWDAALVFNLVTLQSLTILTFRIVLIMFNKIVIGECYSSSDNVMYLVL